MKIYLALPISGRDYESVMKDIYDLKKVLEHWGFEVLHPMTGKEYLRTEIAFKSHGYDNSPCSTNHAIIERDRWMVSQCDIVLMDLTQGTERVSIGAVSELAWASLLGKHTIVVLQKEHNIHNHVFVLEGADIIFESMKDATDYLFKLAIGSA
jgi:nucleoside 2-deoxyribosyltransferase